MSENVNRVVATAQGDEVAALIDQIEPIVEGKPVHTVLLAALSIALLVQNPNIEPDDFSQGVYGASAWIADFLEKTFKSRDAEQLELPFLVPGNDTVN